MSDFNQISTHTSERDDDPKSISISDQKLSTCKNHVKELENDAESYDEDDSEYEDVEEDETDVTSVLTAMINKTALKTATDEDDLRINIRPRPTNRKRQGDEHSESNEENDDHQNVPRIRGDTKQSTKIKEALDDDHNTRSPAYIPRKGKFYEHDDRTLNENELAKQELSRYETRFYQDSDAKWQHDLYFRDEQMSKSRHPTSRQDDNRPERHNDHQRGQFHLNDYMSRSQSNRDDYRSQIPRETEKKSHFGRATNFDFKDYDRSLAYQRGDFNRDPNHRKEIPTASCQQRRSYNPHQIDERTFHRRRDFTNNQFQQDENPPNFHNDRSNRQDPGQLGRTSQKNNQSGDNHDHRPYRGPSKYEFSESAKNLPPRFRLNNNDRNSTQKQESQQNESNMERPKRYSSMRSNIPNPIEHQGSSSSQTKHYRDQHLNTPSQNDWPQAPPPPTSYLPKQIITPQMFYQQSTSRCVSMRYSPASISEQVKPEFSLLSLGTTSREE